MKKSVKITPVERQTLNLIARSPDLGEGWRSVSAVVWPLVKDMRPELAEVEANPSGGGRIRMTKDAETVLFYT